MLFHRISSTSLTIFICWLGVSAEISEGFVTSTRNNSLKSTIATATRTTSVLSKSKLFVSAPSAGSSRTIPTKSSRTAARIARPTMLSYTTSSTASTGTGATTFLSPRRRTHIPRAKGQRISLDLIGRVPKGGSTKNASTAGSSTSLFTSASGQSADCPFSKSMAAFGCFWGSFGVIYILSKAIFRVLPIALEPLYASTSLTLSSLQWSLYALSCAFFAYAEGYKGFHKKFAPLVVKRSFTLVVGTSQGNNPINYLLAPLYSMGLWGATSKRLKVSWGVTLGVAAVVAVVKRLPAAPRCILDAGVVVGLTIGSASIFYHFLSSLMTGKLPDVDACLPQVSRKQN